MEVIIKLEEDIINKINEFAESINTNFYATRGQSNNDKRILDQKCGKYGEFGTHLYLKSKDIDVSEPDCKIYKVREKSWDFDLKADNINLHVKSQSLQSGKNYGISWVFQKNDKHVFNSQIENQYVSFVSVNLNKGEAYIKSVLKLQYLHDEKLFKEPKLDYLKNSKLVVYYDDIKDVEFAL